MEISDEDIDSVLEQKHYKINCWTLASYNILLEKIVPSQYELRIFKDGNDLFGNTNNIRFQIHYDFIQRIVALYFHNGKRGWYLMSVDVWEANEIENYIGHLLTTRFEMMGKVFNKAMLGEDEMEVIREENTKHFYTLKADSNPNMKQIYCVPKRVWELSGEFSNIHQDDYKELEDNGVAFSSTGIGVYDCTVQPNMASWLEARGFSFKDDFDTFVDAYIYTAVTDGTKTKSIPTKAESDFDNESFSNLNPIDYVYGFRATGELVVSPKKIWEETGNIYSGDFEFPFETILTSSKILVGTYNTAHPKEETDDLMKKIGFVRSADFDKFIEETLER